MKKNNSSVIVWKKARVSECTCKESEKEKRKDNSRATWRERKRRSKESKEKTERGLNTQQQVAAGRQQHKKKERIESRKE